MSKLAVIYVRSAVVQSKDQEDLLQRSRLFAKQKAYRVLNEYIDSGVSGLAVDRDGLNRLRAVLKTGGVDVLIISNLHQLSREPNFLKVLLREIREANVTVEPAP